MRNKYWQFLIDSHGVPVPYATIQIFNATTTNAASAYATESTSSIISGGTLITDVAGYFEFWVDPDVYPTGMKFDMLWSKPGSITSGGIYDIYVSMNYEQVDETDSNTNKNKLVSNNLARLWEAKPQIDITTIAASSGTITYVSAGAIETGYDCYYSFNHNLNQGYPIVQTYIIGGRSINCIPVYLTNTLVNIWMETATVTAASGSSQSFEFVLVG